MPRQPAAQGLFKGVEQGAREGNRAAGPVGGVLGGAIGGVVGVVTGVTGAFTGNSGQQSAQPEAPPVEAPPAEGRKAKSSKATKTSKVAKATPMLTQPGAPQLTAEQIVANSDSNIERLKTGLNLTEEQAKNWGPFANAMHALGRNGADRLELRIARSKRDPPDDIVEQMRNEAQFLVDRAADQRAVADTSEPLFTSLDDKQKQIFIDEMVRLSRERGLD
ncbi:MULTISPECIES: Spy/CpxP family protein refolding chaperone [unclassified Bradyrhizobium]|uniref:Spy/CpxP family protein refolding chaperone n=1 Tax=unclassified Bradyrhizobium TaxID=2631580 RepID=UPI0029161FDD|nr:MULTISPECIES: Spy/CpxP family protein refolding chaperone [unclassified Bradyrhizobium]